MDDIDVCCGKMHDGEASAVFREHPSGKVDRYGHPVLIPDRIQSDEPTFDSLVNAVRADQARLEKEY